MIEPTSHEKGHVDQDLHQGVEDPDRFLSYENRESDEDWDAHLAAAHLIASAARIPELLGLMVSRVRRIA